MVANWFLLILINQEKQIKQNSYGLGMNKQFGSVKKKRKALGLGRPSPRRKSQKRMTHLVQQNTSCLLSLSLSPSSLSFILFFPSLTHTPTGLTIFLSEEHWSPPSSLARCRSHNPTSKNELPQPSKSRPDSESEVKNSKLSLNWPDRSPQIQEKS